MFFISSYIEPNELEITQMGLQFLQSLLYQTIIVEEKWKFSPILLMILGPTNKMLEATPA